MSFVKISFLTANTETRELLMARLMEAGLDGFEEKDETLDAFIPEEEYEEHIFAEIAEQFNVQIIKDVLPSQNWNAVWEENFQPVVVKDFCTIRADFHKMIINTPYEIVITPKMSFGTGHHATTQLVMTRMQKTDFSGKSVFDFGTGTGILAILAEMLGARRIVAIDNDEWAYENAKENISRNNCNKITVRQGSIEDLEPEQFDVVIANINRHILLQYMTSMSNMLFEGGKLLVSGLLTEDKTIIKAAAQEAGFTFEALDELDNWILLSFVKL